MTQRLDGWRRGGVLGQLVRFGIAGGLSSVIYSAVYLPLTRWVFPARLAVAAVPFAFAVAVTAGFYLHSKWSFRDHGERQAGVGQHAKFVAVQGSGLAINGLVTWLGTAVLHFQPWVPLLPGMILAAGVTFVLNRMWVFG